MRTLKEFLLDYNAVDFALEELFWKSEIWISNNKTSKKDIKTKKEYWKKEKELIESLNLWKNIAWFKSYYLNNMVNVLKNFWYVIGIKKTIKIGGKKSILGTFLSNNDKIPLEDFLNKIEENFNAFNILNFSLYGEGEIEGDFNVILYIVWDNIYLIFTKPKDYKKVFEELTTKTDKWKIEFLNIENIYSTLEKINEKVFEKNKVNEFLNQTTSKVLKIKNKDKEVDSKIEETLSTIQSIKEIKYIIGKEEINDIEELQRIQPELLIKKSQAKAEMESFFKSINLNVFEDLDNLIQRVNQSWNIGEEVEDIGEVYDEVESEEEEIKTIKNALHTIGKQVVSSGLVDIQKFEFLSDTEIKKIIYGVFDNLTNLLIDNYNAYISGNKAKWTFDKLKGKKFSKEFLEKLLEYTLIQALTRNEYWWKYEFNSEVLNILYNASTWKEKGFNNQIKVIIDYLFNKRVDDVWHQIRDVLGVDNPIKTKDNFKFLFKVQHFLKNERLDINKAINFILIIAIFKHIAKWTRGLNNIFGEYEDMKDYSPSIGLLSTLQNLEFEEENKIDRLKELEKFWREYSFVLQAWIDDKKNLLDLAYVYDTYSFINRIDTFSKQMKELLDIADRILNIYGLGMFVTWPDIEPQENIFSPIDIKREVVFHTETTFAIVEGAEKVDAIIDKRVVKWNVESLFFKVMEFLFPKSFITDTIVSYWGNCVFKDTDGDFGLDFRGAWLNSYLTSIKEPIAWETLRPAPVFWLNNYTIKTFSFGKFATLVNYYDFDEVKYWEGINLKMKKLQKKILEENKLLEVEISKTREEKNKTDIVRALMYMKLAGKIKEDLIKSMEKKNIPKKIVEIWKALVECNIKKNPYKDRYAADKFLKEGNLDNTEEYWKLLEEKFSYYTPIFPSVFWILQEQDELNLISNGSNTIKKVFGSIYWLQSELLKPFERYNFGTEYVKDSELSQKERFLLNLNYTPLKIGSFFIEAWTTTAKTYVPMMNNNKSLPIFSKLGYTGENRLLYDAIAVRHIKNYIYQLEDEEKEAFFDMIKEKTKGFCWEQPTDYALWRALNLIPLTLYKANRDNTNPLKSFQIMSGWDNSLAKKWFEYFWLSWVNVPEDTSYQRQMGAVLKKELEFIDKFNKWYGYYWPFLFSIRRHVREFQYWKSIDMLSKTAWLFLSNWMDALSLEVDSQNVDKEILPNRFKQARKLFLDKEFYKEFLDKNWYTEEEKNLFFDLFNSINALIGVKSTNLKYKDLVEEGLEGILNTNWEEIEGDIILRDWAYTIDPHNLSSISYWKDVIKKAVIDMEAKRKGLWYETRATYVKSKWILWELYRWTKVKNNSFWGDLLNAFKGANERYREFIERVRQKGNIDLINTRGDDYIGYDYHTKKWNQKKVTLEQVSSTWYDEEGILWNHKTTKKMQDDIWGDIKLKQLYNKFFKDNARDNILWIVSVLNKSYFLKSGLLGKMYVLFTKDYAREDIKGFLAKSWVTKVLKDMMSFFIVSKQTFNNYMLVKKVFKKHFDNKEIKKVFIDYFLQKVGEDKHLKNIENVELEKIEEKY